MSNVSLSTVGPVVKAWIAAASIPGSRCGDGTRLVAIEGFLRFSVSHETTSLVPEHTAKHPLAIAGRFLVKTGSRRPIAARQGEDIRSVRRGGFFPLTPALSRGERGKPALPGAQSRPVGISTARGSLFPLPEGDGQGEGERREHPHRVLHQSRNCRTQRDLRRGPRSPKMICNEHCAQPQDLAKNAKELPSQVESFVRW